MSCNGFHIGRRRWHSLLHYGRMIGVMASRILCNPFMQDALESLAKVGPVKLYHKLVERHQT